MKKQSPRILFHAAAGLYLLFRATSSAGQVNLETQIGQIAGQINGRVGVYAQVLETGETVSCNGEEKFPMQSVYKFPIAMAVLDKVDKGELSLDQQIRVDTSEYIPENGHSPLRDNFPGGTSLTVRQLLNYNVAESDGTACDVLLRLLGGTKKAQRYVRRLGVKDIAIATTEQVQVANDLIQYRNWATPRAMTQLLRIFYQEENLSEESKALLLKYMSHSAPWFDRRIKGLLPPGTPVVHKTGTAGTINGLTRATNDAGVITLPGGKHVAISVFIADSRAAQKDREVTIAKISRAVFDHYAAPEADTLSLFDRSRNREVPIALYKPEGPETGRQIVVFSHGYRANDPGAYRAYSYLTEYLASEGYFVVSIQHELPTDSLIPAGGIPQVVRRPFWERGADNIRFVIDELKRSHPGLDFGHISLIGHSNGGDMTALFPQKYPGLAHRIITLDNRRMPLPRTAHPKVYSLRSSDQPADEGVLPTPEEQQALGITIIQLPATTHNEMDDSANADQQKEILEHLLTFLTE